MHATVTKERYMEKTDIYDWINCEEELPTCDGLYEITNEPELKDEILNLHKSVAEYDGFGFVVMGAYKEVNYWRRLLSLPQKRYGKIR